MLGQKINSLKAKKLVDKGAKLVDVRSPVAFRDGTLPGAQNVSLRQVSSLFKLPKDTKIIFFGDTNDSEDLIFAVNYMVQSGFTNVFSLGAMENWNK
jgi:rhodanese-related sulfurtransferase